MTSKEVEKMKNEEVLEILLGNVDYKDYSSETMRLVNSCVSRLWEILERLEALEKENVELQLQIEQLEDSSKIRMQQADKYAAILKEKYLDLIQENKENAEFYVKSRDALWDLKQQNEKLKKAFKLVTDIYLMNYWDIAKKLNNNIINKQEYELLKEVLGNV